MASLTGLGNIVSANAWNIVAALASILVLTILANILQQILLRRSNEPPVVFHWLPVIGNTITYGIDPFKFFSNCQAKVCTLGSGECG